MPVGDGEALGVVPLLAPPPLPAPILLPLARRELVVEVPVVEVPVVEVPDLELKMLVLINNIEGKTYLEVDVVEVLERLPVEVRQLESAREEDCEFLNT